ncbi:MAG: response regulator [Pleurocapsa minor GSE-CHR-MK-17-07R]|jgi:CheY-like chemotaxis protein|nr:response regulator [Pleurocapsa minor GSE-CHR-MK 17-07R]
MINEKTLSLDRLRKKNIFYIDDDSKNRMIVKMIVELYGAKFAFDQWGMTEVMLQRLEIFRPHLILLDLMLPLNVSGYDVFRSIRQSPALKSVPIVIVSASDPTAEIQRARAIGVSGYISKPIDFDRFPHYLRAAIDGEAVWAAE